MQQPPAPATPQQPIAANQFIPHINPLHFHRVVNLLEIFFCSRNYIETHTQNRLSILAACEDPHTIRTFEYAGETWPLPRTGQMWLEHDLLTNKEHIAGLYTLSTSYRAEPNPVPGRHCLIFPMFEFEGYGNFDQLLQLVEDLLIYLGFTEPWYDAYDIIAPAPQLVTAEVEADLNGNEPLIPYVVTNFPPRSHPFWNMRRFADNTAAKADVILAGMETIGCAERSCNVEEMRRNFNTIENGEYAKRLYYHFGSPRVNAELEEFLAHNFVPRFGGGIGITRLISAMQKANLL